MQKLGNENILTKGRHHLSGKTSLIPLLQEAERMRPQRNRTLNSCRLSLQHLNKLQLLNHIDEEVRTLNREHNRFLLSGHQRPAAQIGARG